LADEIRDILVDNIMSEKKTEVKDKTERREVSLDELSYSNMLSIEALVRVLCWLCLMVSVGLCQSKTALYIDYHALLERPWFAGVVMHCYENE